MYYLSINTHPCWHQPLCLGHNYYLLWDTIIINHNSQPCWHLPPPLCLGHNYHWRFFFLTLTHVCTHDDHSVVWDTPRHPVHSSLFLFGVALIWSSDDVMQRHAAPAASCSASSVMQRHHTASVSTFMSWDIAHEHSCRWDIAHELPTDPESLSIAIDI